MREPVLRTPRGVLAQIEGVRVAGLTGVAGMDPTSAARSASLNSGSAGTGTAVDDLSMVGAVMGQLYGSG
jgi:hypothetical protein